MSNISPSSVTKKILMALSGFFLLFFLLLHLVINSLSVINPDAFNLASHFMGTNMVIQILMQPILIFGVIFHLVMGIVLNFQNNAARPIKYECSKPSESSNWISRNMVITGIMILLFLVLHFKDFWVHELIEKYVEGVWDETDRYYPELIEKFENPLRVGVYVLAFVFLGLHLLHGFQSAFQSVGFRHNKYTPIIKKLGNLYGIIIPAGFIFIALFHYFNS